MENEKEKLAREARSAYMREYRQNMTDDQKEKKREYHRQWREKNRDRVKEHNANYWMRKAVKNKVSYNDEVSKPSNNLVGNKKYGEVKVKISINDLQVLIDLLGKNNILIEGLEFVQENE